jgi:hypothetical protein
MTIHRITFLLIVLAHIVLAQSAVPTALNAKAETTSKPIEVSKDDQLKNLQLINNARAVENMIHRLKTEYESRKAQLETEQRAKLEDYGRFITAKRTEYKLSTDYEIDTDKGVWVDRKVLDAEAAKKQQSQPPQ